MSNENQILAVDIGNTVIKVGRFVDQHLQEVHRFESTDEFAAWIQQQPHKAAVVSSVRNASDTQALLAHFANAMLINHSSKFPVVIQYETPETLGIDRICNASYMAAQLPQKNALSIDIGTCIKFDLVTENGYYIGGSIAPGIDLRYKSLNDYTGNLPLLSNKSRSSLVGKSTKESIQSGVMNGMQAEIQALINQYTTQYEGLTFFVTGGDASFFDLHSKNDIFADENLTIKGLFEIYKHNA